MTTKIILTGILFTLFSCKKIPFDYRNKFIGNYEFTTSYKYFQPYVLDSTSVDPPYLGKITNGDTYKTDYGERSLHITYEDNKSMDLLVDDSGGLAGKTTGYFTENGGKVYLHTHFGGLGAFTNRTIVGIKK